MSRQRITTAVLCVLLFVLGYYVGAIRTKAEFIQAPHGQDMNWPQRDRWTQA